MKKITLLLVLGILIFGITKAQNMKLPEIPVGQDAAVLIRKSNIIYDSASFQTGNAHIPPYIANGIMGGCFDHMGFQSTPNKGIPNGRTVLGYISHYYRHEGTTRQAQLPLAWIEAGFTDGSSILNMMDTRNYRQELDIYTGVLTTSYNLYGETKITAFAHQTIPNLFVMKIDRQSDAPDKELVVKINCQTDVTQQGSIAWPPDPVKLKFDVNRNKAEVVSSTNMVNTRWTVTSNNDIKASEGSLVLHLKDGENFINILVHRDDLDNSEAENISFDKLLASHTREWEQNWQRSWIDFPEERVHNIWNRANYYNLSNFPVIPEKALIPTGMNTNIWGFTFPQDVYYVVENLLRSGHFSRYEKSMQYWRDILPEVKDYSRRIMKLEGGYYPWTPPFANWDEFEKDSVVSTDSYQIHNPAYVAAMMWHYYQRTGDREFLARFFPVMEEVWRFYSQIVHKNERGTYDIFHTTATTQDEAFRSTDLKNYLDASFSAEYTAHNYLKAAELVRGSDNQLKEKAMQVLDAGLERDALINDYGYYNTFEGDDRPINSQKHPVQLNAITFLPMSDIGNSKPSVNAWENRYDLTTQARKPVSHGWTYAAFVLSSSRMGKPHGLLSDLSAAQYCAHADPRWIQFYEFTFWERYTLHTAYYFPTHGLYQQALTDALVQDWQGFIDLFACMTDNWKSENFSFKGLYTLQGVSVDGIWNNGKFRVQLNPNGAKEADIRISTANGPVLVSGHQNNKNSFIAGETVKLVFSGNDPIVLEN